MRAPTVSVIIPAYNAELTIRETIDSVLAQTFSDMEIIVVNDGSQDSTADIVSAIQDKRISFYSYPNAGVSASRNRGFSRSTGELVSFLDADDLWTPDKTQSQLNKLREQDGADVAYSWTDFMDASGRFMYHGLQCRHEGYVYRQLMERNFLQSGSNPLISRDAFKSVGGFDESLSATADWDLYLKLAFKYNFRVVPLFQIKYRKSAESMSADAYILRDQSLTVLERAFSRIPENIEKQKRSILADLDRSMAAHLLHTSSSPRDLANVTRWFFRSFKRDPWILLKKFLYVVPVFFKVAQITRVFWRALIKKAKMKNKKAKRTSGETGGAIPRNTVKRIFYYAILGAILPVEKLIGVFKKKKDILIVAEYTSLCSRGIFLGEGLKQDPRYRVWVTFPQQFKLSRNEKKDLKRTFLYISYHLARFLKWDLIVFSNHDRPFRPDAKKIYVRHGISVNKVDEKGDLLIFGKLGYDPGKRFRYDMVFIESSGLKDLIVNKYPLMERALRIGGDLFMQKIALMKRDREEVFREYFLDPSRKTILIMSTWNRSLISREGEDLLKVLPLLLERYNVIVSAHPKSSDPSDPGYEPETEKFAAFSRNNPGYLFVKDDKWMRIVHHCDILVTDSTSAAYYCLPYVEGVIYLDIPDAASAAWEGSPLAELKKRARVVSDLRGLPEDIEIELKKEGREGYKALAGFVLGDYRNSLDLHREEIEKELF